VPVHSTSSVKASRASYTSLSSEVAFHDVRMSSKFTKKSFVNVPGFFVRTPCFEPL
jgi:hypothetical protein